MTGEDDANENELPFFLRPQEAVRLTLEEHQASKLPRQPIKTYSRSKRQAAVLPPPEGEGKTTASQSNLGGHKAALQSSSHAYERLASFQPQRKVFTQLHLDFGQANFACTTCRTCGMLYAPGQEADEKLHTEFHTKYVQGLRFQGWQSERVVQSKAGCNRIIMVLPHDPASHRKKVGEICSFVEERLGMVKGWLQTATCRAFLSISAAKRVVGLAVTQDIQVAYPAVLSCQETGRPGIGDLPDITPSSSGRPESKPRVAATAISTDQGSQQRCRRSDPEAALRGPSKSRGSYLRPATEGGDAAEATHANQMPAGSPSAQEESAAPDAGGDSTARGNCDRSFEAGQQPRVQKHKLHSLEKGTFMTRWLASGRNASGAHDNAKQAAPEPALTAAPAVSTSQADPPSHTQARSSIGGALEALFALDRAAVTPAGTTSGFQDGREGPTDPDAASQQANKRPRIGRPGNSQQEGSPSAQSDEARPAAPLGSASCNLVQQALQCSTKAEVELNEGGVALSLKPEGLSKSPGITQSRTAMGQGGSGRILAVDKTRPLAAALGVRAVWVSVEARRKGVATELLDAARRHSTAGNVIPRDQLAFSEPTDEGAKLAAKYTNSNRFLVYLEST